MCCWTIRQGDSMFADSFFESIVTNRVPDWFSAICHRRVYSCSRSNESHLVCNFLGEDINMVVSEVVMCMVEPRDHQSWLLTLTVNLKINSNYYLADSNKFLFYPKNCYSTTYALIPRPEPAQLPPLGLDHCPCEREGCSQCSELFWKIQVIIQKIFSLFTSPQFSHYPSWTKGLRWWKNLKQESK